MFRERVLKMTLMDQIVQELTLVNVLIALAVTVVGIPLAVWGYDTYRFRQLPPGPPTRPFIGNKHLIPASRPWLKMAEWSETYVNSLPQPKSPTSRTLESFLLSSGIHRFDV